MALTLLMPGMAEAPVLKLPSLSLWGGVDPFSGRHTDPSLPHGGESMTGKVLMIAEPVGSSSSSAVLLELLQSGRAPAAIVLGRADAIVSLGILVAREMGWATIPLAVLAPSEQDKVADGSTLKIE